MQRSYKEVLEILCSSIAPLNSNNAQDSFLLNTPREAKLAHEVLIAYGFDAKLYQESEHAKLYVSLTKLPDAVQVESACSRAQILRQIMDALPDENDGMISFMNTPAAGKQISIHFPPSPQESRFSPAGLPVPPPIAPDTLRKHAVAPQRKAGFDISKLKEQKDMGIHGGGPAIAKQYPFGIQPPVSEGNNEKLSRRLMNYFVGNITNSFYTFFGMLAIISIAVTIYVSLKTYYCADFLTPNKKNPNWYCNIGID